MNIVALLQESYKNVKAHPSIFLPILVVAVLVALFSLILVGTMVPQLMPVQSPVTIGVDDAVETAGMALGRVVVVLLFTSVLGLIGHGMTVIMAYEALEGRPVIVGSAWKTVKRRVGALVLVAIIVGLLVSFGLILLMLPGIVIALFLMFSVVVLMTDDIAPLSAIGKSIRTVKNNFAEVFVMFLIMIALGVLVGIINVIVGLIPVLGAILAVVIASAFATYLTVFVVAIYRGLKSSTGPGAAPEV